MSGSIFWLASYPKSGNTWTRTFIRSVLGGADDPEWDLDLNHLATGGIASSREWVERGLGFDLSCLRHEEVELLRPAAYRHLSERMTEPGYYKVHDAYTENGAGEPLFPAEATRGVLYIARNPLDVAVSYANHMGSDTERSVHHMGEGNASLCGATTGQAIQLRQRLLSWSGHVRSWLQSPLPVLVVRYEDMRLDPLHAFTRIAEFLELPSDEVAVAEALRLCEFERLQAKEAEGGFREKPARAPVFFRRGKVGDWKEELTPEQVDRIVEDHRDVMEELGYLGPGGQPEDPPAPFDGRIRRSTVSVDRHAGGRVGPTAVHDGPY